MKNIIKHIDEDKNYLNDLVFRLNLYNRAYKLPPHELKETIVSLSNALNTLSNYLYKTKIDLESIDKIDEINKDFDLAMKKLNQVKPTNNFKVIERLN